jgi:tRNA (cmo5U34)-methyltransferase
MKKDRVFAEKQTVISPFRFSREVAAVFDDMLVRSVPFYAEALKQQARMAKRFYQPGSWIYDLGCSHGNMGILLLDSFGSQDFSMTAVDNSLPMLEKYRHRLKGKKGNRRINLVCAGMTDITIAGASVVIINLTLQFLDPGQRDRLIKGIYKGLAPGGILLLTEKTCSLDGQMAELEQEVYQQFKRDNGYSELEISQKRDALEQVLIPEAVDTHEQRLKRAGFARFSVWLKWFNFTSMLAVKA